MDTQNQARMKQIWGPPPELGFAVAAANKEREIQKALDGGKVVTEFALRRQKLVHPDSDDEFDSD